ncbi:Putative stomatin/prohibitin-family membrane protease subunit YbbK [hydrothermal vent metagenome]|uniref:Putative stomatin/prohibitin-family membrane protease subunit YbbK n=1 Tax=hydrothermal vent metagenome TaxID=652676 RepID=A0A1W1BTY4_9ZZZZ
MEFLYGVGAVFVGILVLAYLAYTQFVIVESETEWIVDRLGKDRVLKDGVRRFVPILDKKVAVVDMREETIDPPAQEIITSDNIKLEIDMIASVRVVDSMKAIKTIANWKKSVESAVAASTFTILGNMNLEDIQKQVKSITDNIAKETEKESMRWGIKVEKIHIENMKPPKSVVDAMEREIAAERDQKAAIIKAEGEHKVKKLHAESEQLLMEKRAEVTHKIMKELKELFPTVSDEKIMDYLTSKSYIDSMKALSASDNSKFVLFPSDMQNPMDKVMSSEYMSRGMTVNKNTEKVTE